VSISKAKVVTPLPKVLVIPEVAPLRRILFPLKLCISLSENFLVLLELSVPNKNLGLVALVVTSLTSITKLAVPELYETSIPEVADAFTLPKPTVVSVAKSVSDCTTIKSLEVAAPAFAAV